jgi:hypothetical protein
MLIVKLLNDDLKLLYVRKMKLNVLDESVTVTYRYVRNYTVQSMKVDFFVC